jgi:hypothetical protein
VKPLDPEGWNEIADKQALWEADHRKPGAPEGNQNAAASCGRQVAEILWPDSVRKISPDGGVRSRNCHLANLALEPCLYEPLSPMIRPQPCPST